MGDSKGKGDGSGGLKRSLKKIDSFFPMKPRLEIARSKNSPTTTTDENNCIADASASTATLPTLTLDEEKTCSPVTNDIQPTICTSTSDPDQINISEKTGPVSFKVDMGDGREWRRHQDQLISTRNRYSLSRAGAGKPPIEDSDKEELIDASNVSGTEESAEEPAVEPTAPTTTSQADTPQSPPSPKFSARALRTYNRSKKNM